MALSAVWHLPAEEWELWLVAVPSYMQGKRAVSQKVGQLQSADKHRDRDHALNSLSPLPSFPGQFQFACISSASMQQSISPPTSVNVQRQGHQMRFEKWKKMHPTWLKSSGSVGNGSSCITEHACQGQ